jgi:hypothetical protein
MTADEDSTTFGASGYDHQETVSAERIVAVDAGRERLVACTDSTVYVVTDDGTSIVDGPDDRTCDDIVVGRASVCLLADGTVYPLTESGLLNRSYDVDAETIARPVMSSIVIAAEEGSVAGFDVRTGRERFRKTPSVTEGVDKVVAGERQFYALDDDTIVGYDARGRKQFDHAFSAGIVTAGEVGDTLIVGLETDRLVWLDVESGEVSLSAPVAAVPRNLASAGDRFLFGVMNDDLMVIDPDGKLSTPGTAGTDTIVQTYDGSLVGRVLPEGLGVERLVGSPAATVEENPDGLGPVVKTNNPLPIAASFSLSVETDEDEEHLEYSVNAGDVDQTPIAPLVDIDSVTSATVQVETEDGRSLLETDVDILPTDGPDTDSEEDVESDADSEASDPASTPSGEAVSASVGQPSAGANDPSSRGEESDTPAKLTGESFFPETSQGSQLPGGPTAADSDVSTADESADGADIGPAAPMLSVTLNPEKIIGGGDRHHGTVTLQLRVRNKTEKDLIIKDVKPKRPVKLRVDDTITNDQLSSGESTVGILSLPDRGEATVAVDVEWVRGSHTGRETVEATIPKERLDFSAEIVDTGTRPAVAVTAENRTEAVIKDRITFTTDGLPAYEEGLTHNLTFSPGRHTVTLVGGDAASSRPDSVRIDGEAIVGRTTVNLDTSEYAG